MGPICIIDHVGHWTPAPDQVQWVNDGIKNIYTCSLTSGGFACLLSNTVSICKIYK